MFLMILPGAVTWYYYLVMLPADVSYYSTWYYYLVMLPDVTWRFSLVVIPDLPGYFTCCFCLVMLPSHVNW